MRFSPYLRAIWIVALFFSAGTALAARQGTVSRVTIISNDPFHGVRVEKGKLVLPAKPGLGLTPA